VEIEYDPVKAESNLAKHGVSFEEAATVLLDPEGLALEDIYSEGEARWVLLGMSDEFRLLVVVYSLPSEDRIRLISARPATKAEEKYYAR
jgi:uncharacterized protein